MNPTFRQRFRWSRPAAIMGAVTLFLILLTAWLLQRPAPMAAKAPPKPPAKTRIQQAVDFLRAGNFDDAFLAADPEEVRQEFLREIRVAEINKSPQLPQLYEGYLKHAPLPRQCWYRDLKDWDNIVYGLQKSKIIPDVAVPGSEDNSEAKALFDQILVIAFRRTKGGQQPDDDMPEVRRLARRILRKYPDTVYAPMAAVAAARLDGWHADSEPYLEDLGRGSSRTRLALLRLAADERRWSRSPDDRQRAIEMYREILTTSATESEKAHAQYEIARLTMEVKSASKIAEGKKLLSGYWQKYPKSANASWARFYFVQATIDQGALSESFELIERFRQEDPDWSMAATAYVKLAGEYRARFDYAEEVKILRRVTDNYPGTSAAAVAWATIAHRGPGTGGTQEEYDALEKAVMPVTAVIDQPSLDQGELLRNAMESLERLYIIRQEWHKAMKLCLRPRPGGRMMCGNESMMEHLAQCKDINVCVQHLPDGDPLREEGIAYIKQHGLGRFSQASK